MALFRLKSGSLNDLAILYLALTLTLSVTYGQKTAMRSCDCEYTIDGKCAYTLMLPVGNNQDGSTSASCPNQDQNQNGGQTSISQEQYDQLEGAIDQLRWNMTQVNEWNMQHSNLLLTLQNRVLNLQEQTSALYNQSGTKPPTADDVTIVPDTGSGDIDNEQINQSIRDLQSQATRQTARIDSLQESVDGLTDSVSTMRSNYDGLDSELSELNSAYERLGTRFESTNMQLQAKEVEIMKMMYMLGNYTEAGALCLQKGLMVDGDKMNLTMDSIEVTSSFDENHGARKIRINYRDGDGPGAWCPQEPNSEEEWIQFDLGSSQVVYGVVTKGRQDYGQWVTSYRVQYSTENVETMTSFTDVVGDVQIFPGNDDQDTAKTNMFWQPITARYIRIVPLTSYAGRNKCLRADVIGCIQQYTIGDEQ